MHYIKKIAIFDIFHKWPLTPILQKLHHSGTLQQSFIEATVTFNSLHAYTCFFPLFCRQCCRTFSCFSWSLVDVLTRIVLTGIIKNYVNRKITSYIYLLIFTISQWLHVKHLITIKHDKGKCENFFFVITGQD
jgi:hypothetical protein